MSQKELVIKQMVRHKVKMEEDSPKKSVVKNIVTNKVKTKEDNQAQNKNSLEDQENTKNIDNF